MKKVLIYNAVPTNNGDVALVFAIRNKLIEAGYDVIISTLKYDTVIKLYPDIKWIRAEYEFSEIQNKIFRIVPELAKKIMKSRIKNNKLLKDIDIVISAPGGYINSYYGIENRLYCLKEIKNQFNTKLVMYSQSVGPLNDRDKDILDRYIGIFDLFMARDEISYNNVSQYKNTIKTNDAAFLLNTNISYKDKENIVAISVREWKFDGRKKERYINLIKEITMKCIDNGNRVEFISTCQGLKNYVDDSKIAKEIVQSLNEEYKTKVTVNDEYNSLNELRSKLSEYKFVIGTRLHMCILSIMAGVPAFNISYEVKGKECYKMLNLSEYSIDYNANIDESLSKIEKFIINNKELRKICIEKAKIMNEEAEKYFNIMIKEIFDDK